MLPFQATPITVTPLENFRCALSTEGASKLHVTQPGAQNHRATGLIASCTSKLIGEPSIRDAAKSMLNLGESDVTETAEPDVTDTLSLTPPPQPAIANAKVMTKPRTGILITNRVPQ